MAWARTEGDERFALAVLNPAVIQFMLTDPPPFTELSLLGDHLDIIDRVTDRPS